MIDADSSVGSHLDVLRETQRLFLCHIQNNYLLFIRMLSVIEIKTS